MMCKLFCDPRRDYKAVLRRRIWILAGCLVLGVLMILLSKFAFPSNASHAQNFVRGFYSGAGAGMIGVAVILLIRTVRLLRHDDARRSAQIKETDERQQLISMRTFSTASSICFGVTIVALIISAPLNFTVFLTLLAEFWVSVIVVLVTNAVYNKKL